MQNEQENEQENNLEPEEGQQDYQNVFSKNALEFATVAREFCVFAENATQYSKADFLLVASRLVPLLYMKAALLPETSRASDDDLDEVVDFYTYDTIRRGISDRLTSHDSYLTTAKEDFKYSETPVLASISEDLADLYQDIRNFCEQYHCGDNATMNDALATVIEKFKTYWGQRACNALGAIHAALYSGDDLSDEAPATRTNEEVESGQTPNNNAYADALDSILGTEDETDQEQPTDEVPLFMKQMGLRLVGNKKK